MKKRQRNWSAEDDLFRRQVGQLCGVSSRRMTDTS